MATNKLERTYTIPLRSGFVKVPKYYRAKRAINQIRKYIVKHMKNEDVRIGSVLNEHIWSRGITNPPGKVTVKATHQDGYVAVELEGYVYKVQKVQTEKTDKPTSFKDKLAAKLNQSKEDVSKEDKSVDDKVADSKVEEKADDEVVDSKVKKESSTTKPVKKAVSKSSEK